MTFSGFPPETLSFLTDLGRHNDKTWFDDHRHEYEKVILAPARAFITLLGEELRDQISPAIRAEPRVNGSIFRLNRDTRFSRDKRPYKEHLDLMFWEGQGRSRDCPGFFLRLTPQVVTVGSGKHAFDERQLERFRQAVLAETSGSALVDAVDSIERNGARLGEQRWKRVPRGLDPEHPLAHLLRYGGLHCFLEDSTPKSLHQRRFVDWCMRRFVKLEPLHRWLVEHVA